MKSAAELLEWTRALGWPEAMVWSLVVNGLVFVITLAVGGWMVRVFRGAPVSAAPDALSAAELRLAGACVLGNSLVMWLGWWLFRSGWLRVATESSPFVALADALILLLVMDFAMYVAHRLAHHPLAFRYVHGVHHRYERVRPLTLFVLHPLEVLGFGGLWLGVLLLHAFSLPGMLLYLTLNTLFGVLGHVGVEPFPPPVRALPIGSSSFHAHHHQDPRSNFGFYTSVWDRLFRTLDARD